MGQKRKSKRMVWVIVLIAAVLILAVAIYFVLQGRKDNGESTGTPTVEPTIGASADTLPPQETDDPIKTQEPSEETEPNDTPAPEPAESASAGRTQEDIYALVSAHFEGDTVARLQTDGANYEYLIYRPQQGVDQSSGTVLYGHATVDPVTGVMTVEDVWEEQTTTVQLFTP